MREPFSYSVMKSNSTERAFYSLRRCSRFLGSVALSAVVLLPMQVSAKTEGVSAPSYSIESAAASTGLLLDVTRAGKRLIAVGDRGHILYTDDEGQQWRLGMML